MKKTYICPVTKIVLTLPSSICTGSVDTSRYYKDPETGELIPITGDDKEEPEGDGTLSKRGTIWDDWDEEDSEQSCLSYNR